MAGVNRSQVNRWGRGENRPGYDPARRLAAAVWGRRPDLARELIEASGYAWSEPQEAAEPEPKPELDDDQELLETLRRVYRDDPDGPEKIREVLRQVAAHEASGQSRSA